MMILLAALLALPPVAGNGAAQPFLSPSGNTLVMSWLEPVAGTKEHMLRVARFRDGKWSAPRTVTRRGDFFVNWADFPSVVEDASGTMWAHWLQKSGSGTYAYDVRVASSKDGGKTWSNSTVVHRDGKKVEHGFVSLAPSRDGVAAVWLDGRNMKEGTEEGDMTLRYATLGARGMSGEAELDARTCECCATGMAMTSRGPVIVYRDLLDGDVRDISVVRRVGGKWTAPRVLHRDNWVINGCPVNGPQIDAIGERAAVAWFTAANDKPRVQLAFSDDAGATFAAPVVVDDGKPLGRVDVVMLDAKTALVTWLESAGNAAEIRARRVTRDGTRAKSTKIADSSPGRGAGVPRMAKVGRSVYVAYTQGGTVKVAKLD